MEEAPALSLPVKSTYETSYVVSSDLLTVTCVACSILAVYVGPFGNLSFSTM